MLPLFVAKISSLGHWMMSGLFFILGRLIWKGTGEAKRRNKGEHPVNTDGGSFNRGGPS